MGENISQSEIKSFFVKIPIEILCLMTEDRGRPSDFNFFTENLYLSIFANYLTSYRKYG